MKHLRLCSLFMTAVLTATALSNPMPVKAEEAQSTDAVSAAPAVDVSSDNAFGSLIAKDINEQMQFDENCAVLGLYCAGASAVVNFQTTRDAILVVGLYDDSGVNMLAVGQEPVKAGQTDAVVGLSYKTVFEMPEHYLVRAYLVGENQSLISKEYVDPTHTAEMEELAASDVNDYDGYTVLNLDDSEETNFMVYEKDVKILSCDGTKNVIQIDDNIDVLTIENYTGPMEEGSIVSITYADKAPDIFRILSAKKEGTLTKIVWDQTLTLSDAFAYVKIQGSTGNEDVSLDGEIPAEPVITPLPGQTPAAYAPSQIMVDESSGAEEANTHEVSPLKALSPTTKSFSFKLSHGNKKAVDRFWQHLREVAQGTVAPKDEDNPETDASKQLSYVAQGQVEVSYDYALFETKNFEFLDQDFQGHAELQFGIEGHAELKVPLTNALKLLDTHFVTLKLVPYLFVEIEGSATLCPQISFAFSKEQGLYADTDMPTLDVSGKVRVGIGFEAKLQIGDRIDIGVDIKIGGGAEIQFDISSHSCTICVAGEAMIEATLDFHMDVKLLIKKERSIEDDPGKWSGEPEFSFQWLLGNFYISSDYGFGWGKCPGLEGSFESEGASSETDAPSVVDDNTIEFELDKETDTYTVMLKSSSVNVVIPATYKGKSVTRIAKKFRQTYSDLKCIVFPDTITEIPSNLFSGCTKLEHVTLPASITSIPDSCFAGCEKMRSITIPSTVTAIGAGAFQNCSSLTPINLPSDLRKIGDNAFFGCKNITAISVPSAIEEIGFKAFSNTGLETIRITSSSAIDSLDSTFVNCTKLKSAFLDCSLKDVTDGSNSFVNVFEDCTNLETVSCPVNLKVVGQDSFFKCHGLKKVILPTGLKEIGYRAFADCTSLKTIKIPNTVEAIGKSAFEHCTGITKMYIPDSVQVIKDSAFANSYYGLTSIRLPSKLKEISAGTFRYCWSLAAVQMPDNLKIIGDKAFYNCTSLHKLDIPDSVEIIGNMAFYEHCGVKARKLPANLREIGQYAFCSTVVTDYYNADGDNYVDITAIALPASLEKYHISALNSDFIIVMNPNMEFIVTDNKYYPVENSYIYGYSGSTAEAFATENKEKCNIRFIAIDGMQLSTEPPQTTTPGSQGTKPDQDPSQTTTPDSPGTKPDQDPPQTITFKDLKPNTLYNFYDLLGEEFTAGNLLFLSQGMSDSNGTLTVWYRPKEDDTNAKKYVKSYAQQFGAGFGDVNGDNHIDVSDAVLLARFCAEDKKAIISGDGLLNADVNHDTKKDGADIILILQYIARLISSFD